jgi:hypothetical protein
MQTANIDANTINSQGEMKYGLRDTRRSWLLNEVFTCLSVCLSVTAVPRKEEETSWSVSVGRQLQQCTFNTANEAISGAGY